MKKDIVRMSLLGLLIWGAVQGLPAADKAQPAPQTAAPAPAVRGDLPAAVPLERYQRMLARSPFALASAAVAVPAPVVDTAGFARDLFLTGIARMGGGEYLSIATRDQTQHFGLMTGESYNEITVVSVAWSDEVGKTKATLKRGNEYGVIGFDEAAMRNGAAGAAGTGGATPGGAASGGAMIPGGGGVPALPAGVTLPNPAAGQLTPGAVPAQNNPANQPGADLPPLRRRPIRTTP